MEPGVEHIEAMLAGGRPAGGDLSGVTLDGKRLPRRERVVAWDLSGVNLRGSVFTRLDLSGATFKGADLSGAAFRSVGLQGADLRRVSAAGAIFEDVNLAYASFREADLRGASFSFANLADIDFKRADMRGASVNAVRFSLNGATHALALKEALCHRYGELSYPLVAGISGDAFWLSYVPEQSVLDWGGFPDRTLTCGLDACGFESEFVNELDVEEAWRRLREELARGRGAITPVHVGGEMISGSGFGGSEWVYVSDYDAKRGAVRVRCLLGEDLQFTWEEFVRSWCIHHPLHKGRPQIVYTICVIGDRTREVRRGEAVLRGIEEGIRILDLGEYPEARTVCGLPAYDLMLRDLDVEPAAARECCRWLGLGLRHHHGSRWAIRDFLKEGRDHLVGAEKALDRAIGLYDEVLEHLAAMIRTLPASIGREEDGTLAQFLEGRDDASRHLRTARTREGEARGAMQEVLENAEAG